MKVDALRGNIFLCIFFCGTFLCFAQKNAVITSEIDTTFIKIGEQINFKITVEADSAARVIFPEGQTFSPLETVEAFKTDTTRKKDRITLQKTYALTQFDSGSYKLPTQRIEIDGKGYFTDSLLVNVATVPVDTTTQKMYDIKPLINVDRSYSGLWKIILLVLLGLALAGGLAYWFFFRKKPLTEEEKEALLPAYDRALLELKRLENSKYLIQDEYKKYYSELTAIVRSYLEEEVHVSALESTTNQLINKLELMKDAGELNLDEETIHQFKKILETADLVKFAKSKPATSVAELDRKAVEDIVIKTKEAIPEPTLQELMEQKEYQEEMERKKRRKKIYVAAAVTLGVVVFAAALTTSYYGFSYVRDTVFGHPTKDLLEGEWVNSSYGYPPISLESPEVLIRQKVRLPQELESRVKELHAFMYTNPEGLFSIGTTSTIFSEQEEPDYNRAIDEVLKNLEKTGAKNIITKQEEFTTLTGVKGIKVYGNGNFPVPDSKELVRGKYAILLFGGNGFQQQIILSWVEGDTYAQEMADRILKSVDVKTQA
jgi:flagellar basal body-associated protein FliL